MKQATLTIPEIGLIAVTRGMAGAGVALLLAGNLSEKRRKAIGWRLLMVGALTTVPLILDVVRKLTDKPPVATGAKIDEN